MKWEEEDVDLHATYTTMLLTLWIKRTNVVSIKQIK